MLLISRRAGPLLLMTSTSASPSLSTSPNAAPRLTSEYAARLAGDLGEAPVSQVAKQLVGLVQRKRIVHSRQCFHRPDLAVEAQQVQPTVVVEVEQPAQAIYHFRQSLLIRPDFANALYNLANALAFQGEVDEAMTFYRRALAVQPDSPEPLAELAWLLAAHPDPARRDPLEAVTLAERAASVTSYRQPGVLDVLAAAYAAAGQFDRAVTTAETALGLVPPGRDVLATAIRQRLEGYRRSLSDQAPR